MAIPTVTLDELIEPEWGNAVAAAIAALEAADSAIQSALGVITANGWVTTARIADGQVTEAKLASNSVTAAKIAAGAVNTSELATGAVTTAKIADGDVTEAKLANSAVTTNKLANNSVTSGKIVNGTIVNADISDSAAINTLKLSVEYTSNGPIRFVKIGNMVFCWVQSATGLSSGDQVPNGWEPAASTTFMIHRHTDAAHRAVTVSTNGNMTVDGRDGTWSGYGFWMVAS